MSSTVKEVRVAPSRWSDPAFLSLVLLTAIGVVGIAAWIYQLSQGLIVTGMRNVVSWGLYITMFMLFVGMSAGGLVVASAGSVFGADRLKPLSRLAIWVAFACVAVAAAFVLPDLGRVERLWHLLVYPQWGSPLTWDLVIVVAYGALCLVYLWLSFSKDPGRRRLVKSLSYVALPTAIALHTVTAWILGLQLSRPYWFTGILAPLFISSALVSGLAFLLLVALALRRLGTYSVTDDIVSWLGGLLSVFIAADFFMLASEFVTRAYARVPDQIGPVELLVSGQFAWVFWGEVMLGVLAFVVLVIPSGRRSPSLVALASGAAVVSIFLKRLGLILAGFHDPIVNNAPGISIGQVSQTTQVGLPGVSSFAAVGVYAPTWVEYVIALGWVALCGAVILWGVRSLPLEEKG